MRFFFFSLFYKLIIVRSVTIVAIFVFFVLNLNAQNDSLNFQNEEKQKKWSLNGYVKDMQTVWISNESNDWIIDNLLHNRLNFKWFPNSNFTAELGMRNRLLWGEIVEMVPNYDEIIDRKMGYFNLSKVISYDSSYVLHTMLDRAFLDFTKGKWQITAGRQRINWGINLVWNPNDIFNTFSYFDFDYEERPGTDAVKIQYYNNYASSTEFVYKIDEDVDKMAFAGMYKFNKRKYDFQFLGGLVQKDIVFGLGWAGQIKDASFRGEATYFHPKDDVQDTNGIIVASISGDYTFKNSLFIHAGILFNSDGTTSKAATGQSMMMQEVSAKSLTRARYSVFGQIRYPLTPLLNFDISSIYNPNDKSVFVGPSLAYSMGDNLEFMLSSQIFMGDNSTEFGDYGKIFFLRIKNSF